MLTKMSFGKIKYNTPNIVDTRQIKLKSISHGFHERSAFFSHCGNIIKKTKDYIVKSNGKDYIMNSQYNNNGQEQQNTGGSYAYNEDDMSWQNTSAPQYSWEYRNNGWQQNNVSPPPIKPPKKKGKGALKGISLVLACAIAGFGGGMVADYINGSDQTVVYRTAENSETEPSNISLNESGYSLADVAAVAGQSVVSLTTETSVSQGFGFGEQQVMGAGSGVILSEDGTIITNNHVISGADKVTVTLSDGSEYEAEIVGGDPLTDVGVIKIDADGLVPAVVGDSSTLAIGETCVAIGNSMGTLGGTVTDGIISAIDRDVSIEGYTMELIQMSAAVSPGNSGGGLFNSKGELIGIVNAKSSDERSEGLGFAIPVNTAIEVSEQLVESGYVQGRPAMGISAVTVATEADAYEIGVSKAGVYIIEINKNSAAEKAGMLIGDRIISVDGYEVLSSSELATLISEKEVGDAVEVILEREGRVETITVTLQESQASTAAE